MWELMQLLIMDILDWYMQYRNYHAVQPLPLVLHDYIKTIPFSKMTENMLCIISHYPN